MVWPVWENFRGPNSNGKKGSLFSMFSRVRLCVGLKVVFKKKTLFRPIGFLDLVI
jgi:hypothetical protein